MTQKQKLVLEMAKAIAPTITYYWLSESAAPLESKPRYIAEDAAYQAKLIVEKILQQED